MTSIVLPTRSRWRGIPYPDHASPIANRHVTVRCHSTRTGGTHPIAAAMGALQTQTMSRYRRRSRRSLE